MIENEAGKGKGRVSVRKREEKEGATSKAAAAKLRKWRRRHHAFFGKIAPDSTSKLHSRRARGRRLGESAPVLVSWSKSV